ncbi:MAG TPA: c-type cytochrome [Bryobacteraceae bacterium]|nr:c-type cytochrome [Bryobacteraceae bacterium]
MKPVVLALFAAALSPAADLPDGPGKELVQKQCASCHGLYKVTDERKTEEEWAVEVDKMVATGATLSDAEFDIVVKYLAKNFGPEKK